MFIATSILTTFMVAATPNAETFPEVKFADSAPPRAVEIQGFPAQNIITRSHPPKIFWECKEGFLLQSEVMPGASIVVVRKEFTYPLEITSLKVDPRPDIGGGFFLPYFYAPGEWSPDFGGQLVFQSLDKICALGELGGVNFESQGNISVASNAKPFGRTLFNEGGRINPAWRSSGPYLVVLWEHSSPKKGTFFLVCNAMDCKQTPAYQDDRGFAEISNIGELIEVTFRYEKRPPLRAKIMPDRSVRIENAP